MKRRSPAAIATLVLIGGAYFSYRDGQTARKMQYAEKTVETGDEAASSPDQAPEAEPPKTDAVAALPTSAPVVPTGDLKRFSRMPDGSEVPGLPSGAPQRVKMGIALFRYKGAQGPPASTRTREEALSLAKKAQIKGEEQFSAAVKMGDRGSAENIGWMKRGVLEPAVEYALFTVDKGKLSKEPIDTPRGFWVVRRIR